MTSQLCKPASKLKRALVFWFWNDTLDKNEISRQIEEFHRQHIDGFFIHPMPSEFRPANFHGGMPGYLSDEYFDMVQTAVDCAKKCGMDLWLYDEGGWPSGGVNGKIVSEYPDLRLQKILPDGRTEFFAARPDLLNPAVTQLFIDNVHEKYRARFAGDFGKTIKGIFTDEPAFGNFVPGTELPWSPVLAERFAAVKGYDARNAAMKILNDNDPQARIDYCEIWVSLILENFLYPVREWCRRNNLLLTGHFNGDDTIANMLKMSGCGVFELLDALDVPGCDAILRQIHPAESESDLSGIVASAAKNKTCISESFAVYGPDLSLAEMKSIAARQFVSGIDIIAAMALHYSDRGGRQVSTVSNFFSPDPRWEYYHLFADFCRRLSKVSDRTVPVFKAAVPFPVRDLQGGTCRQDILQTGLKLAAEQKTYLYSPNADETFSGEPDIELSAPCPGLRTRHLLSPRGERRIFVNSTTDAISCRFTAPAGYNVWYDPATGRRTPACADSSNCLDLFLPFAGAMVLLTLPGKVQKSAVIEKAAEKMSISFEFEKVVSAVSGSENGLQQLIPPPEIPDKDFCGIMRYRAIVNLPERQKATLCLPQAVRAMCELLVNGTNAGRKAWGPYNWDIEFAAGENILQLDISTTAMPAVFGKDNMAMLNANDWGNSYLTMSMAFKPFAPDEAPLNDAFISMK